MKLGSFYFRQIFQRRFRFKKKLTKQTFKPLDNLYYSDLIEKRKQIVNELVELRDSVSPFIDLFEREDVKKLLETDR